MGTIKQLGTPDKPWVIHYPYERYYSILVAGYIISRSTPQLYAEIRDGKVRAVTVDGTMCLTHEELTRLAMKVSKSDPKAVKPYIPENLKGVQLGKEERDSATKSPVDDGGSK